MWSHSDVPIFSQLLEHVLFLALQLYQVSASLIRKKCALDSLNECFIITVFRHLVCCSPEPVAGLLARPSDALHEAFWTDLCVSVLGAGLLALQNPSLSLCLMPETSDAFRFWRGAKLYFWIRRRWKVSHFHKPNISCLFEWMNRLYCWKGSRGVWGSFFSLQSPELLDFYNNHLIAAWFFVLLWGELIRNSGCSFCWPLGSQLEAGLLVAFFRLFVVSKTLVGNTGFCAPFRMIISLNPLKYYGVRGWAGRRKKVGDKSILMCLDGSSPI